MMGKGHGKKEKWAKRRQGRREKGREKGYPLQRKRRCLGCGNDRREDVE